jgi:hypothetical protein
MARTVVIVDDAEFRAIARALLEAEGLASGSSWLGSGCG